MKLVTLTDWRRNSGLSEATSASVVLAMGITPEKPRTSTHG